jgi:hypothetical protein
MATRNGGLLAQEIPMMRFLSRWIPLMGCLLFLSGCGSDDDRQAVSGTVTIKGKPIDGTISFVPASNETTQEGSTIENGKYSIPREKGLIPGTYKVKIYSPDNKEVTPDPGGNPFFAKAKERIPAKYNESTTLTREVKRGGNAIDFNLD